MKLRDLTFASMDADNVNPRKLNVELGALPELAPWRDGLGNLQTSFWIKFNDEGELVVSIPVEASSASVTSVVHAHDPAPPDDIGRGQRMRQKVEETLDELVALAQKYHDGTTTAADRALAMEVLLLNQVRLARLFLRLLDAEA